MVDKSKSQRLRLRTQMHWRIPLVDWIRVPDPTTGYFGVDFTYQQTLDGHGRFALVVLISLSIEVWSHSYPGCCVVEVSIRRAVIQRG